MKFVPPAGGGSGAGRLVRSAASPVEGVGVEDDEEDEDDGGDEAEAGGAADVPAELAVDVADLVPPRVRVALQPHPGHGPRRARRRRHDARVNHIKQNEDEDPLGTGSRT